MTKTPMPNVTFARERSSAGGLKEACEKAFNHARLTGRPAFVGTNYCGFFITGDQEAARGSSNVYHEVTPMGRVMRVDDRRFA